MKTLRASAIATLATVFVLSGSGGAMPTNTPDKVREDKAVIKPVGVTLDKGVSGIEKNLYDAVYKLLQKKGMSGDFYVGSVNQQSEWALISVSRLLKSEFNKTKDHDGSYLGEDFSVIAKSTDKGKSWKAAFEGDQDYKEMIRSTPDSYLDKQAKNIFAGDQNLNAKAAATATVNYKFPWQELNPKIYSKGWHGQTPGFDFRSTASDRRILSAAAGTITNVNICTDTVNVTVSHSDGRIFKYLHLSRSEFDANKVKKGISIPQGRRLGLLKKGVFNDNCGYAEQTASTHHLHWGLPTNVSNTIDQWTIVSTSSCWTKPGFASRCPGNSTTFGSTNKEV